MVNSAFYGFPSTISTIPQAITILGRDRLRQILIGSVLGGVFGKVDNKVLVMEDFWQHSVKTAILSRYLCRHSSVADQSDTLFTAGLLHGIGRLIIAQKLPQQAMQIKNAVELEHADLCQAENEILSFTHCDVGAAFINKWGLPKLLSDVAQYYQKPELADDFSDEIRLVHMASKLTFLVAPIEQEEVGFALEDIEGWEQSGVTLAQITEACRIADEQVFEVMESFGMGTMRIDLDD
jgi:HD-like signal output (HDOD) protein